MNQSTVALLGATAGMTIFLGLPVARLGTLSRSVQGFLNAAATGILIFLLWDVLSKANDPAVTALRQLHRGQWQLPAEFLLMFVGGIAIGLMSLIYFNGWLAARLQGLRWAESRGHRAATAGEAPALPTGRALAMMTAVGLGLHNMSEGLAVGQAAATGAIAFAGVLVIGFALHNMTEGFGIGAPMAADLVRPSYGFLALAGLVGGGPTFVGTLIGYRANTQYILVFFLSLAAGALIYVISEMLHVGRKMRRPATQGWGLVLGFALGYGADLLLSFVGG